MNIPYRIYGGLSFYHRKEIKDILAYLRLVLNTNDEEALKRVINYPTRGIGKTTMDKVMIVASENNISLFETLERAREFQIKGYDVLGDFVLMIRSFQTMLKKPAYDVAMHVAKQTGLLKSL
jgi:DNA helicase-2/ATP-dependent DNA helicase PcrA